MTLGVAIGVPVAVALLLYGCQRQMIYLRRSYDPSYLLGLTPGSAQVEATTSAGRQVAFYIPPRVGDAGPPRRLWMVFGGNAALALDWLDFVDQFPDDSAGFYLIDYPGYGLCEGRPTRRTILESNEALVAALAQRWGADADHIAGEIGILGHSIGAAVGLEWAAHHRTDRLVLLAPFTSMVDMAKRVVGWPLGLLVKDRFDNRDRLREVAQQAARPSVVIFHGTDDTIVPPRMSRELAQMFPDWIRLHEVADTDHNLLLWAAERTIVDAMTRPEETEP